MGAIVLNCRPATPSSSCPSQAQGASHPASGPTAPDLDRAILDDPALVVLRDGVRRVVVAPELGGSLAAFYDATPHGPVHWLRPTGRDALDAADPLLLASFPLLPYCNRIRDGRFRFDGRDWQLPMGEGALRHALHGHAWLLPWQVAARGEASVELRFDYEPAGPMRERPPTRAGRFAMRPRSGSNCARTARYRCGSVRAISTAGRCRSASATIRTTRAARIRGCARAWPRCGAATPICLPGRCPIRS